ncbi:MAG TPA: glycosyltransferase family 2 protein [Candidatus Margulisiibacteriota bacterium]|nr:glycosyltransferase family 2 protein [Candidatus Margulisiibacteriota bacterium]
MKSKTVNIIILNYNGEKLLQKYLPSVLEAAKKSDFTCQVTVVDNCSTDGSIRLLRDKFSQVGLFQAKENKVMCSLNEYLALTEYDIVIFLNNDVKVDPDFVDHLVRHFADPDILFVAPKELDMYGKYRGNLNRLAFRFGILSSIPSRERLDCVQYDATVGGGAFDRARLLYLGGFDEIFLPGICEDFDVCYRGWKHGWKGLFEPKSFYYHEGSTTFDAKFGRSSRMALAHRNSFLFFWKNVTSRRMIFLHLILLPLFLCAAILRGRWVIIKGFSQALARLPLALKRRGEVLGEFIFSDEEVRRRINLPYGRKAGKN